MCSDCGVALVDELPAEPAAETPTSSSNGLGVTATPVWRGAREFDAHTIRSMLESNGIQAEVWGSGFEANVGFDDLAAHRVMVKAEDAQAARNLLATID